MWFSFFRCFAVRDKRRKRRELEWFYFNFWFEKEKKRIEWCYASPNNCCTCVSVILEPCVCSHGWLLPYKQLYGSFREIEREEPEILKGQRSSRSFSQEVTTNVRKSSFSWLREKKGGLCMGKAFSAKKCHRSLPHKTDAVVWSQKMKRGNRQICVSTTQVCETIDNRFAREKNIWVLYTSILPKESRWRHDRKRAGKS